MSLKSVLFSLLAAVVAGAVFADQPAPLPGAAPAEEWASNADLAGEVARLQVKPPQNSSFDAYHVKDVGVQAVVPVKLALVGADPSLGRLLEEIPRTPATGAFHRAADWQYGHPAPVPRSLAKS